MSNEIKALLLIGDGMADRPVPELDGKTPIEAAKTPTFDRLAREGECGSMDPIAPGVRAGSDTAHLAMLGYDPYEAYSGRGPFEAVGIGMDCRGGDVAFRCNFSTVNDELVVLDRRAGRITERTDELAAAVNGLEIEGITCLFKESTAHRGALVLRGKGLSDKVGDVDPHHENEKVLTAAAIDASDAESAKTAEVLNQFVKQSYELLKDHPVNKEREAQGQKPANIILPRGSGVVPSLDPFDERHNVKSACIVEVGLVKGIARFLSMDVIDVPEATGGLDTDVSAIGAAVVKAFEDHDFVLCNVKGPDLAGHDGEAQPKVAIIEKIDGMLGEIMAKLGDSVVVAVTADHSTPVTFVDHAGDSCPILFAGPTVRPDEVVEYGERAVARGAVGRIRGTDVMNMLTNLTGGQEKFGA